MSVPDRPQRKVVAWIWALVVAALLAHNGYLWLVQRVAPGTDIMALLPVQQRDAVLQQSFTRMVDAAQQRVIVLIGAPDWQDARAAADAYRRVVAARPDQLAETPTDEHAQQDWLTLFQQHRLVLVDDAQRALLQHEPAAYWTEAATRQLYSPFAGPKLGAWRDDPFGLFAAWVQTRAQESPVRPRDGYLFVADHARQYVLVSLLVREPVFAMATQRQVVQVLNAARQAALQALPHADIITAGVVLHAAAAGEQARGEIGTIGVGSLLGVVLLTWLVFRSLRPILMVLLSIGVGLLGAVSLCWLLFGQLHLLTLVFGASLIGVAQDYGIYYLAHRLQGAASDDESALLKRLLPSLALTLLAAVIGYAGLALTPFPGLRSMALFSALGLVFAWLTVLCWFPQLVKGTAGSNATRSSAYTRLLDRWPTWRGERRQIVMALVVACAATTGILRLHANDDIRLLQSSPPSLVADQLRLAKLLDAATPVQYFLVRGTTEQDVLAREEMLKSRLEPMIAAHLISGYQAMSNWVPSAVRQADNLALVRTLLDGQGALAQLAGQLGEDQHWTAETSAHLLDAGQPLTIAQFMAAPASEPWRHLWLGEIDGVHASIVALRGLDYRNLAAVRRAGDGVDGVQWVDKVAEISSVLGRYRVMMAGVLAASYVLVSGLLSLRYRRAAWRVVLPTALATALTLGLLGWAGQPLQLFHVLACMLLLGVGVDYGIFMQEPAGAGRHAAWLAIGLSAANTLLSFGLLALSQTAALRAFGLTMLSGVLLVWLIVPLFRKEVADGIH